jgi:deoxyribonuclease V
VEDDYGPIRRVAGLDVAYIRRGEYSLGVGVAAVLHYPSLRLEDCVIYVGPVCVPYIPGLLAFREMAVLGPILAKLGKLIDLYVADGHGIAHPRRFGIASHVGVVTDTPSIGVAKKRLYGREVREGTRRVLVSDNGERIAAIIESGRGKAIYVSPGHRISLESAVNLVKKMMRPGGRLPEPTRIADSISKRVRNELKTTVNSMAGFIGCSNSRSLDRFF